MSDIRDVANAHTNMVFPCEECDEHHQSPKAALYCADRDREEAKAARYVPYRDPNIIRSID